ncbi:MAG: hypothetical protein ABIT20_15625 [Gemmatimonadaceae bacterium]
MMRIMTKSMTLCLLVVTACINWGNPVEKVAPANGPQGARVAIRLCSENTDRVGELFAVDSIGVTVREARLIRVSWAKLAAMDVKNMGSAYDIGLGETVTAGKRATLAPLSRFPQGLSGDLLRAVLSTLGQVALEEVR